MTPAARYAAAIDVLDQWLAGAPLEKALTGWARKSRYAGSKDRAAIRDIVFDCVRSKRSFAAQGGGLSGRGLILGSLVSQNIDANDIFTGEGYAAGALQTTEKEALKASLVLSGAVALDFPDWLEPQLRMALGDDLEAVAEVMRQRAPVYLRTNLSRGRRQDLITTLEAEDISAIPSPMGTAAVEVTHNPRKIRQSNSFLTGLAEFQDAASQAICEDISLSGSEQILDYCAGGGGKALALADRLKLAGGGQVFAHDIDPARMKDIPVRAARAGLSVKTLMTETVKSTAPFDLVFCDAPCSGSGAWRRAPEGKWLLTPERLADLSNIQKQILDEAVALVKETGTLVYATCSLLNAENEDQIEAFLTRNPGWKCLKTNRYSPLQGGDGFFAAHLTREV